MATAKHSQPTQLVGIGIGLGGAVLMWLMPSDVVPDYLRWPLVGASSLLVVSCVVSWLFARPFTQEAPVGDININSTNQSGGFTGILVQGAVNRQLDESLKAQLLEKLPKGTVGVAAMMGVPDGERLAGEIAAFLHANGYKIGSFIQALMAGGMPRGISIQRIEDEATVVINHP